MKSKKMFVVSDIHGHYTLLREALDRAGFDKDNEDHLLICCGDYFDRGTKMLKCCAFSSACSTRFCSGVIMRTYC